jgi:hypothetical protein
MPLRIKLQNKNTDYPKYLMRAPEQENKKKEDSDGRQ